MAGGRPFGPGSGAASYWDQRFAPGDWPRQPEPSLVEVVSGWDPARALDFGCGPGRNALWLAARGWRVTGVDVSPVALEQARSRAQEKGLELDLELSDLYSWRPPEAGFQLVLVANMQPPPRRRRRLYSVAVSALAPGGRLLLIGHHLDDQGLDGPQDPRLLLSEEKVRRALAGIELEWVRRVPRERLPGRMGAEVTALARASG